MNTRLLHPVIALLTGSLLLATILWSQAALGHGEEIEIDQSSTRGPVMLTAAQTEALGLTLVEAELRPISKLLTLYGELAVLPDSEAAVTVRVSGRIAAVYTNVGDHVGKGQKLALLEARAVGNPPPKVPVLAPMAGVIDWRKAELGQPVEPSSTLFHIIQVDRMRVVARVYEEDIAKMRVGLEAYVHLLAFPDQTFRGQVRFLAPTLDSETRTAETWIFLDNRRGLLKPNLFAKAGIVIGSNASALAVPNAAIMEAQGEKFLFVKQGNRYVRQELTLGLEDNEFTAVTSGLVPGDQVVTQGARELYTLWLTGSGSGG